MFSELSAFRHRRFPAAESFAKLRLLFELPKLLTIFIRFCRPNRCPGRCFPKASAKVEVIFDSTKYFQLFFEVFFADGRKIRAR